MKPSTSARPTARSASSGSAWSTGGSSAASRRSASAGAPVRAVSNVAALQGVPSVTRCVTPATAVGREPRRVAGAAERDEHDRAARCQRREDLDEARGLALHTARIGGAERRVASWCERDVPITAVGGVDRERRRAHVGGREVEHTSW